MLTPEVRKLLLDHYPISERTSVHINWDHKSAFPFSGDIISRSMYSAYIGACLARWCLSVRLNAGGAARWVEKRTNGPVLTGQRWEDSCSRPDRRGTIWISGSEARKKAAEIRGTIEYCELQLWQTLKRLLLMCRQLYWSFSVGSCGDHTFLLKTDFPFFARPYEFITNTNREKVTYNTQLFG